MSADSLLGCVSKMPLFVLPQFALNNELLECIRYKLHDYGFITVCEEHRLINIETASKICHGVTSAVNVVNGGGKSNDEERCNLSHKIEPSLLVGRCYVFVLARSNCLDKVVEMVCDINRGISRSINAASDNEYKRSNDIAKTTQDNVNESEVNTIKLIHLLAYSQEEGSGHQGTTGKLPIIWTTATSVDARRAVSLLFPQLLSEDIPTATQSREYVQAHLKQALLPALTELCKTKPQEPIRWLAEKLLNTNTQAPPMISHNEEEEAMAM